MGNLIFSQPKPVTHPYYVPELGVHLYTGEELSYYIYHNVLLIEESFPDERVLDFLEELDNPKLAERLRRMKEQHSSLFEMLYALLQDLHYYSSSELYTFRGQLEKLARSSAASRLKAKGDYLFGRGQYYSALRIYNQILDSDSRELADSDYVGKIWSCEGACYANLGSFEQAADCLKKAFELNNDPLLPEKLYVLNVLMGKEEASAEADSEVFAQFASNLENRRKLSIYEGKALEAAALQDKDSTVRGEAFLELLYRWKEEYRKAAT